MADTSPHSRDDARPGAQQTPVPSAAPPVGPAPSARRSGLGAVYICSICGDGIALVGRVSRDVDVIIGHCVTMHLGEWIETLTAEQQERQTKKELRYSFPAAAPGWEAVPGSPLKAEVADGTVTLSGTVVKDSTVLVGGSVVDKIREILNHRAGDPDIANRIAIRHIQEAIDGETIQTKEYGVNITLR